jgi:hypothetical protein
VSKALHFKHEVPVTVRFSANSGMPKIADADPRASPRGLAIRFRLPDGSDTDFEFRGASSKIRYFCVRSLPFVLVWLRRFIGHSLVGPDITPASCAR